jgi:hypothetical protein
MFRQWTLTVFTTTTNRRKKRPVSSSGNQNGRKPTCPIRNWTIEQLDSFFPCWPKDTKRYIVANSRNLRISVFKAGQNSLSTAGCFPPLRSLIRIWMRFFTTDFPDPALSSEVFFRHVLGWLWVYLLDGGVWIHRAWVKSRVLVKLNLHFCYYKTVLCLWISCPLWSLNPL